jgi:hypothetical protein
MDFTIKKLDLLSAIDKCAVAVPKDHQQTAFSVMRVEPKKKTVRFAAVGETASVDTVVEGDVKSAGFFNVRPKHLRDVAASMPDGKMQFSVKGNRVTVKSLVSSRKASFESHSVDIFSVDDPGKDAPWIEVKAAELERGLRLVRAASQWEDRPDPAVSLLIPTERGLDIFASNGYMVALAETSLRVDGIGPIQMPEPIVDVLFQMSGDDDQVRLFANERRVFLENCDTLVTASLPQNYIFATNYVHALDRMRTERTSGPVVDPGKVLQGVKSVLTMAGFANDDEKKRGMTIHLKTGETVSIELTLGIADARDEFPAVDAGGADLEFYVGSTHLLKLLGSFAGVTEARVFQGDGVFILQSQGITCCMAVQRR